MCVCVCVCACVQVCMRACIYTIHKGMNPCMQVKHTFIWSLIHASQAHRQVGGVEGFAPTSLLASKILCTA